jgi:mRNA interferase MazF
MAITSQLRPSVGLGETWLRHWQSAGLLKPCSVKPVFTTLEQRLVIRVLGVLDTEDQANLHAIGEIIG